MKLFFSHIKTYFLNLSAKGKIKWSIAVILFIWFWFLLPSTLFNQPTSFVITDKDGNLLNASIAADGQWRFPYNKDVPEKFIECITTFEDKRFYYHPGVDPIAIVRAIKQNFSKSKTVSGGSTLTMQVIRLYKQNDKRNLWNKLSESILAIRLECSYRKKSIMALYAANAPFGSNVVGLDAAAWRYYGRNANQLSWGEMAALAVLPNAPALVHPGKNRATLLDKRNRLLEKLLAEKIIDEATCNLSKAEPLPGEPKALPQFAPHLLDRFKREYAAFKKENKEAVTAIQTTIDGNLQFQVNNIIWQHHSQLRGNQIKNAAAMVVEVETGNVLAYVGNVYNTKDSAIESNVDVLSSARSPGSTLKPLLYASMLNEGAMMPFQLIPDIPTQIGGYTPQNFDLGYDGAVPANRALSRSLNIPAVKLLQQYKYQRFYDVLKQCDFSTLNKPSDFYGMSLILGGCEINPYEMAGVYSSMARSYLTLQNNKWKPEDWRMPNYFKNKENRKSNSRDEIKKVPFDLVSMWHTFNAMNEVMRPGEEGLWGLFSSAQKIAWKTGTSFGFRDGWAVGFTPKYCVVVWVGNTTGEGRPELTGINTAAPILFDVFRILPRTDWFKEPTKDFAYANVCRQSGFRAGNDCEIVDKVLVTDKHLSAPICPYCRKINLDKTGVYRVNESCASPSDMQQKSFFVLPPTIEYYYRQNHPSYKVLPDFMQGCTIDAARVLDIVYPDDEARIFVPKEITGEKGRTVFTATHKNVNAKLFWHIDDEFIATTKKFHQIGVNPIVGKHVLTVVDEQGNSVTRKFEIIEKD